MRHWVRVVPITNADLIAEVRRLRADNIAPQSSRNRLVALAEQLADALEASQTQMARLRAKVNEALQLMAEAPVEAIDAIMDAHNESYPTDLLAAVRSMARFGSMTSDERTTLTRYGLIEAVYA